MPETISIELFWDTLSRSGLLEPTLLAPYRQLSKKELPLRLIEDGLLTAFQLRQLVKTRSRGFFIGDKYKVLEVLGAGGMGRVVLCEHLLLERFVAVKIMSSAMEKHPNAGERFIREARAAAVVDHPHVARIFDVDKSDKYGLYMVMEYIDGSTLERLILKHGKLAPQRTANYAYQVASGLEAIHQLGLIHRDIKPSNLIIDRLGKVKILDLGLARFSEPNRNGALTAAMDANALVGSIDFIAPEQAMDCTQADIRSDIYSLGCTLYFLLARKLPAGKGTVVQKLMRHHSLEPVPLHELVPEVPEDLAAVVAKMMRKKPEDRFQTPAELLAALKPCCETTFIPPPQDEMPSPRMVGYRTGLIVNIPSSSITKPSDSTVTMSDMNTEYTSNTAIPVASQNEAPSNATNDLFVDLGGIPLQLAANSQLQVLIEKPTSSIFNMNPYQVGGIIAASLGLLLAMVFWLSGLWSSHEPVASNRGAQSILVTDGKAKPPTGIPEPTKAKVVLHGGGSTFINPMISHWASLYEKQRNRTVRYESIGSSKGVEGLLNRTLDFGCTDAPLTDKQMSAEGKNVMHIPLVMGAVVPTYNVLDSQGAAIPLRFTGSLLANIYLGKTKRWNDPSIATNNPGIQLPDLEITVVARSDGSGTTNIWTDYLSKSSSTWKMKAGTGNKVTWPIGITAEKNNGVADQISRVNGAIGYVELNYALANGLTFGPVMNREGNYVKASPESISEAAAGLIKDIPADLRYSLTDATGPNAYPIVGTTWALIRAEQLQLPNQELAQFLIWVLDEGQGYVRELNYGPIPPGLSDKIRQQLNLANSPKKLDISR